MEQDLNFPFNAHLTEQGLRNLMELCPEVRDMLQAFNDGYMSYYSTLACIIEVLAQHLKYRSRSYDPIMN